MIRPRNKPGDEHSRIQLVDPQILSIRGPKALKRDNDLFVGSDRGGQTAATLHRFVGSCKLLGADPFSDLKDVLERLPTHPRDHLGELLPDAWSTTHPTTRRKLVS